MDNSELPYRPNCKCSAPSAAASASVDLHQTSRIVQPESGKSCRLQKDGLRTVDQQESGQGKTGGESWGNFEKSFMGNSNNLNFAEHPTHRRRRRLPFCVPQRHQEGQVQLEKGVQVKK